MNAEPRSGHSTSQHDRRAMRTRAVKHAKPRSASGVLKHLKIFLGVLAFFGLIVAPIERGQLPELLDHLGVQPSHAQTPQVGDVVDGTLHVTCKDPDNDPDNDLGLHVVDSSDPAICYVTQHACPVEPITNTQMEIHGTLNGFCVATITSATKLSQCSWSTDSLKGYTYKKTNSDCRLVTAARCSSGLHRISHDRCRQTIRRTWTCDASKNEIPRNEFNKCYRPPADYTGSSHPACQSGAPHFTVSDCETYVGQDFLRSSQATNKDCTNGFATDGDTTDTIAVPTMAAIANNDYWCRYDAAWLRVDCHKNPSPCQQEIAMCVKRISEIGGCNTIAKTMQCRTLQAKYPASIDEEALYTRGCTPCVVLPYKGTSPTCPNTFSDSPDSTTDDIILRTLEVGDDFYWSSNACHLLRNAGKLSDYSNSCGKMQVCMDPPRGSIDWKPSHTSGFAVVNTPIIVSIQDVPSHPLPLRYIRVNAAVNPPKFYLETDYNYYVYPTGSSRDDLVRTWPVNKGTALLDNTDLLGSQTLGSLVRGGECLIRHTPLFQLRIEPLWPDNPAEAQEIKSLFGNESLDWWDQMGGATITPSERLKLQDAYTAHRGSTDGIELVDCNYGSTVWCRWTPKHSGYYRLQAVGAWRLRRFGSAQQWLNRASHLLEGRYNTFLGSLSEDNVCPTSLIDAAGNVKDKEAAARDRDCLKKFILDPPLSSSPEAFGLNANFNGLLAIPADEGEVFATVDGGGISYGTRLQCPPIDLRVSCGQDSADTVNITATEHIGILVYETRTSARRPSIDGQ